MTFTSEEEATKYAFRQGATVTFNGRRINPDKRKLAPAREESLAGPLTPFMEPEPAKPAPSQTLPEATLLSDIKEAIEEMKKNRWQELQLRVERDIETHLIKSITIKRVN